jgi:hypothetical protein
LILLIAEAVCTKEAVTAGGNAPLTSGSEAESNDYFRITYSQVVTYFSLNCFHLLVTIFESIENQ